MSTFTSALIEESRYQVRNHWNGELLGSFPNAVVAKIVKDQANWWSLRDCDFEGKPLVLLPGEKTPVYEVIDQKASVNQVIESGGTNSPKEFFGY